MLKAPGAPLFPDPPGAWMPQYRDTQGPLGVSISGPTWRVDDPISRYRYPGSRGRLGVLLPMFCGRSFATLHESLTVGLCCDLQRIYAHDPGLQRVVACRLGCRGRFSGWLANSMSNGKLPATYTASYALAAKSRLERYINAPKERDTDINAQH